MYKKEIIIQPICHGQVMLKMLLQSIDLYVACILKRWKIPKQIELMTTENKNGNKKSTHVYYENL